MARKKAEGAYENQIDTFTPSGKLVFQVIGAVAEFERDIIKERVVAGLANAKRKGSGKPNGQNLDDIGYWIQDTII